MFANKKNDENESKSAFSSQKQSNCSSLSFDKPDSDKRIESTNSFVPNQASNNTLNDSKKEFSLAHHQKFEFHNESLTEKPEPKLET